MRRVTTNDFEQGDWVEYSADGIRLINDIRRITRPDNDSVTIDMTIVVVCLKGRMTVTIDSTRHTLTRNHVLFLQPNSVVTDYQLSDDFTSRTLVFSLATIENSIYLRRKTICSFRHYRNCWTQWKTPDICLSSTVLFGER